jgi:hypothetical protein
MTTNGKRCSMTNYVIGVGGRLFVSPFLAIVVLTGSALAGRAIVEPDWDDQTVQRAKKGYDAEQRTKREMGVSAIDRQKSAGDAELSLPRWGFTGDLRATPNRATRRESGDAHTLQIPDCVAKRAKESPVRDKTGTWYVDNYDFGCLHLSVSADRNFDPDIRPPTAAQSEEDCSPAAQQRPVDAGAREFEIQVRLDKSKLHYVISGECYQGAEEICQDRRAQCALIGKFDFKGGEKK